MKRFTDIGVDDALLLVRFPYHFTPGRHGSAVAPSDIRSSFIPGWTSCGNIDLEEAV